MRAPAESRAEGGERERVECARVRAREREEERRERGRPELWGVAMRFGV